MFSKRNKLMNEQRKGEKITRYGIKKYSFGAASVAVAFGIYFANGPVVTAQEVSNATSTEASLEVPATSASEVASSETPAPESQVAESSASQSSEVESATSQEEKESQASQEVDKKAEEVAAPTANAESPAEANKPARRTPGYAVKPVPKPSTASMPRATNQGQSIPQGTGFRDSGATGITPGTGPAGADDATSVPRVAKPTWEESERKNSVQLAKQITWLDFSDNASWKNLDASGGLQVGTIYKKEISPGYEVTLTVTELKPFNSTEIYKKRVEGTSSAGTYNPDAKNDFLKSAPQYGRVAPSVKGAIQNQWTTIRGQGFNTQGRKTQIVLPENSTNWGVKFNIEATYRGKQVKPSVVMADGEDANPGEFAIFTTNGAGWEYLGEWKNGTAAKEPYTVITKKMVEDDNKRRNLLILRDKSVDWDKYLSPDTVTGGLGTQVFGPNLSNQRTVPVVMTRGASEVGFYVASSGQQAMMMGFLVVDGSDAPDSYGEAFHTVSSRDSLTNATINQPYLGTTPADIDVDTANDWTFDDRKELADEGASQLLTDEQLANSNDLLDLSKAQNGTYKLKIKASPNGNPKAYIKAWVDFNQNGVFDDNEGSEVKAITAAGDHTLSFNAVPGLTGGTVNQLGMRLRIATNAGDIDKPTGFAFSGEVEDMLLHRIYPPQGEKQSTDGFTGQTQTASLHFTPKGTDRSDDTVNTVMSTQAPQVLDNQGNVLTPTSGNTYVRPEGTYVVTHNGNEVQVAFTPTADFSGTADGINIRWKDSNGSSTNWQSSDAADPNKNDILNNMDGRYVPTVRKIPNYESNGLQGLEQNKTLVFNDDDANAAVVTPDATRPASFVDASGQPLVGNSVPAMANGQQVGTYELDPNTGQVTFKPNKSFFGTPDPVVVQVMDADGKAHRARYQPTVTKVTPTSTNDSSTGLQGQAQSGKPTFTAGDPAVPLDDSKPMTFEDGQSTKTVQGVGVYTINSDGSITFTPEKQYVGTPAPVTVKRVDVNGTEVTATYTPTVTKVTPTSTNATSEGLQGQPQKGKPTFTEGDPLVPLDDAKPMTFEDGSSTKKVPNVGTYVIESDGSITFTPEKQYVGTPAPVTVKRVDKNGTEVTAKYTPTVTKVTPTSTDATSNGVQGQPQTGNPVFTPGDEAVPIDLDSPMTFEDGQPTKSVPGVGVYTINPDGSITFTPDKQYVGTPAPVMVKRVDKNGTEVTAKYTPTVTKVTPTSTDATSNGVQGQPQKGKPTFTEGDPLVPLDDAKPMTFEDGSSTKKVPNVGTYVIESDGSITFTPDKQYVGTPDPVVVKRVDKNGTEVTAQYTPTVTKVTPTSTDATSNGVQGQPQKGKPTFTEGDPLVPLDDTKPMTFEDGSSTKKVPNVGTYVIESDGTITFTPEKQYVGTPDPVTVKRVDKNGTEVTAKYTPTVTKVTPTSNDATSNGIQGQPQTGTPVFTPGDDAVPIDLDSPMTFEDGQPTKTVQGVGVYTINPDGSITFTPEKQYVGTPDPVVVKRVDKNGTEVTAKYTPTVTKVTPTSTDATSNGVQGQPQKGTPTFTEGDPLVPLDDAKPMTFEDGSSTKKVPNVGTYVIESDGSITFTPEKQYVGTPDPVTVKRVDKNGTEVTAKYTPTVTKVTPTSTNAVSNGVQGQPQTGTPVFTPGDSAVPIDLDSPMTFEDGQPTKTVPGVGVYSINPDGSITFTPDKQYVGTPDPVVVKRVDKNGTEVTAKYTPTVTKVTPTSTNAESTGVQGQPQKGTPTFTEGDPLVPLDDTKPMTFEDGSSTKKVPNVGTYVIESDGSITFTPDKQYVGTPDSVVVKRVDKNGTEVTAKYTPTVTKVTPTSTDATSNGVQGIPQTGAPVFTPGDEAVPIDLDSPMTFEDGQPTKTVPGVGVYTINSDGSITFTPDKQYVGTPDPVVVKRVDKNGTEVTAQYTPTVTKVTPTSTDATSNGVQGQPQTGTPVFTPGDSAVPIDLDSPMTFEDGQPTKTVQGVGVYTINSDGSITFTPDKQYVGTPAPVTVKRVDKNGTEVTAKYTPTVTKVTPTSTDATSNGVQGIPQTGTPVFTPGDPAVPIDLDSPMTFEDGQPTKTVPGVGEYSINPDGSITFTPDKQYVGTPAPVTVKRVDKNGTEVTAQYTPTVTKVTPTSTDATSTGVQGQPQKGTPTFTEGNPLVPLDDAKPMTFEDGSSTKTVPNVGVYTINPDGSITFTPDKQYVGTPAPVTLKRVDKNGREVTATYTPTVTKVTPTSSPATSTGPQGLAQTGSPVFTPGDPAVPIDLDSPMTFEDGKTTKSVPGVGEYAINSDGTITFTPDKQYVGTPAAVVVKRVDKNGTEVTATYTPTVTKVTPTSEDVSSTGLQGQKQTGMPTFNPGNPEVPMDDTVPMTFEDGSSTKSVPGVGEYAINPDGSITFTPDKQFVGKPDPVRVKRVDKNGTPVTADYQVEVTRVTPTSTPAISTGLQGQPQTGSPVFKEGAPEVPMDDTVPMTFEDGSTTKSVPGVGDYSINPDGSITFTPDKQFVGTPDPVTVKRVDKNGTPVTATYTPTVTKVTPTSTPATSTGLQGLPQTGTPSFKEGAPEVPMDDSVPMTFEDGSSTKTVPNVGVYTINPDGSITFTPDKQFVGTPDPVTVKRVDKNGTPVTATYTPTVTKVTPTSTPATSTGLQGLPQTGSPVFTPGNPEVPMDDTVPMTFEDGSSTKKVPNVGEYTINPDGSITFTPDKQFVGTPDPVTVKRVDKNGTVVTATYTPTVNKVTPTSTPATSTGAQGLPQTGSPVFTPGIPEVLMDDSVPMTFEDGSSTKTVPNVGVYTINPDSSITFTPDKQFVGTPDPVTVKRVDKNGTEVTATYTPTVTKVTPISTPATSTGLQGLPQTGSPVFTPGIPEVPMDDTVPMTFEDGSSTKTVPNVGVYTINPDGSITFTPDKQFVGTPDPVTIKRVDKNGTEVTATYTPTVTKVTPTSTPATSTGAQGLPQTASPSFTPGDPAVPMDDSVPMTFEDGSSTKSVPGVGEYTINPDGSITFTPDKQFVGTPDPVTVKRVDKNGTPVTATYQATVLPVAPIANDDYSSGVVNQAQTGQVKFVPGSANINGTEQSVDLVPGSLKFVVNGQAVADTTIPALDQDGNQVGTYSLAQDGTVTFTPNPGYVGQPVPARVQATDVNGTTAEATYSPVVNASVTSEGMKGQSQSKLPDFKGQVDTKVPAYLEGGVTSVTVPGQGTYTVNPETGQVTFTPEPDFIGQASPITVIRRDVNGKELKIQYIPTVYGQVKTQDTTSTGYPGEKQTGTPVFEGDVDLTIPATFENGQTELTVPGEGTYVLNPDGSVTFTPEAGFLGQASGVKVVRVDRNGRKVTAQYVPTVVPLPVAPSEPEVERQGLLPATGEAPDYSFFSGVALTILASVGLVATRKRQATDED
ncbi:CshA/CshB family fibrillar adhesin-related protein [Abiotrophia defectiva]|uniref:CshA/CshB family fibrillar adhesin-related protein n=1 Tax=Abiotrophia defectiva TaxID=46125 RepID=UPI0037C16274